MEAGAAGGVPVLLLPGILMPAALRYVPLLRELDAALRLRAVSKELEIYAGGAPPAGYAIADEVAGISRAADAAGFERFHLYGHSGGGACALAYVAEHPERVLSLALDEPATDFSEEHRAEMAAALDPLASLPPGEKIGRFLAWQLAPGVTPPPPPPGPPPVWMASRPAGVSAFQQALRRHPMALERLRAFDRPVYYSHGSLSSAQWLAMRDRLARLFPDFTAELYEGASHVDASNQREPARVAAALVRLWGRAPGAG